MLKLIRFEITNVFKGISFYICGVCIIFLSACSVGASYLSDLLLGSVSIDMILEFHGYSARRFMLLAPSQNDFPMLIGILATILICSGYSEKSYKNIWSRGFSRFQLFTAKSIAIALASVVYCLISMLTGFIIGFIFWGIGDGWNVNLLLATIIEILLCISIGMIFTATSFIFKKMGIAIVIAVATPSLMSIGSAIIDLIFESKAIDFSISAFIPSNVLCDLALNYDNAKLLASGFLLFAAYFIISFVVGYLGMYKDEM